MKKTYKILALFVIMFAMCLASCSQNTSTPSNVDNTSKASCVGSWEFEMQGDDENELWVVNVELNEDKTCSIKSFTKFGDEIDNLYEVEKSYYIVENAAELTEDLIEKLEYDDAKCTFVYNAETDKLATTFDAGAYISFARQGSQTPVEVFFTLAELEQYLTEK